MMRARAVPALEDFRRYRVNVDSDMDNTAHTAFARGRKVPPGRKRGQRRTNVKGLLAWLKGEHPEVYEHIRGTRPDLLKKAATVSGLADVAPPATQSRIEQAVGIAEKIASAAVPLLQTIQQQKIFKAQLELAKAGKPLLDTESLQVPASRVEIEAGIKGFNMKAVGIAAAAAVALLLLLRYTGKRQAS